MRMRKKRNLEPRIASCGDILLARGRPCLNLKEAAENYRALIDCESEFHTAAPVELEIGCGNGAFIVQKAMRERDTSFLCVEICTNVIITAMERIKREGVPNVRFLNIPAEILPCYVKEGSVRRIYLNFSTPLPEKSRERQRLTSSRFLNIYDKLLSAGGEIVQKTDSEEFFEYSLDEYRKFGYKVKDVTRDLHNSDYAKDNIVTEYESIFLKKGLPIFRAVAVKGD